ncbi:MAG: wax ester/triacylglycerol synthase family O-acyltransferase [Actinomycetota bacterium]|nr:wax ester/triacylglycerol synthase family O-acyltransferase [Actinomycetota bacterium]
MEPLAGVDAAFLAFETGHTRLHVAAVLVLDPPEGKRSLFSPSSTYTQIRRVVEQRIHLVPQLRRRAVKPPLGICHPVWVDDPDFHLDDHLSRAALPEPGGVPELEAFVAEIMAQPLDLERPLWEMIVLEGLAGGRTALVAKVHHAMLDGVSGASLLAAFLDTGPRARTVPFPAEPWSPDPLPSTAALLRHAASSLARQPQILFDAWQRGVDTLVDVAERNRRLADVGETPPPSPFGAPRTALNGAVTARRRFATVSVPLDGVHLARRTFGGTINDVVLTAVGGALIRLLEQRQEHPDRPLVAMVPVSTRLTESSSTGQRGGLTTSGPTTSRGTTLGPQASNMPVLGNQISGMLVSLETDVVDPVERLAAVSRASRSAKEQQRLVRDALVDDIAQIALPAVASRLLRWTGGLGLYDRLPPLFNVTVSSVPGPGFPLWCAGSKVVSVFPIGPVVDGVGLNVTCMSYQDMLHFGLLGCRRLAPDVDAFAVLLREAFGELVDAAVNAQGVAG